MQKKNEPRGANAKKDVPKAKISAIVETKIGGAPALEKGDITMTIEVNAMGDVCPIPVVKTQKAMKELGGALMKAFVYALSQQETLPDTILCYNGGVKLTCEGSESLEDLKGMAARGVEILSCGTCLNFYDLKEKLAVGEVTNMYVIVEKMSGADRVVRP